MAAINHSRQNHYERSTPRRGCAAGPKSVSSIDAYFTYTAVPQRLSYEHDLFGVTSYLYIKFVEIILSSIIFVHYSTYIDPNTQLTHFLESLLAFPLVSSRNVFLSYEELTNSGGVTDCVTSLNLALLILNFTIVT